MRIIFRGKDQNSQNSQNVIRAKINPLKIARKKFILTFYIIKVFSGKRLKYVYSLRFFNCLIETRPFNIKRP